MEHEDYDDTKCNWCVLNGPKRHEKRSWKSWKSDVELGLFKLLHSWNPKRILTRALEIRWDSLSLRLQWKTTRCRWGEKLARRITIIIIMQKVLKCGGALIYKNWISRKAGFTEFIISLNWLIGLVGRVFA